MDFKASHDYNVMSMDIIVYIYIIYTYVCVYMYIVYMYCI